MKYCCYDVIVSSNLSAFQSCWKMRGSLKNFLPVSMLKFLRFLKVTVSSTTISHLQIIRFRQCHSLAMGFYILSCFLLISRWLHLSTNSTVHKANYCSKTDFFPFVHPLMRAPWKWSAFPIPIYCPGKKRDHQWSWPTPYAHIHIDDYASIGYSSLYHAEQNEWNVFFIRTLLDCLQDESSLTH